MASATCPQLYGCLWKKTGAPVSFLRNPLSLFLSLLVELPPHKERKFGRSYMRRDVPNTNEGRIKCFFVCKVEKSDGMRQEGLRNRPQVGESSSDSYIHEFISVARHRR